MITVVSPNDIAIIDGDTLIVKINGEKTRLRARFIDCPESPKRPLEIQGPEDVNFTHHLRWGERAKDLTSKILAKNSLGFIAYGKDKYGRTLSDWYKVSPRRDPNPIPRNNIQAELVKEGLAFCYMLPKEPHLLSVREGELVGTLLKNQARAKGSNMGFWRDIWWGSSFLFPDEWRRTYSGQKLDDSALLPQDPLEK